jgi:hypothetical protein
MGDQVPKELKKVRENLNDAKWTSLKARGITPPKNDAERQQRLKEAHGY